MNAGLAALGMALVLSATAPQQQQSPQQEKKVCLVTRVHTPRACPREGRNSRYPERRTQRGDRK